MRPKVYARKKVTHDSRQNSNFQQPPFVSPSETVSPSAPFHCHPASLCPFCPPITTVGGRHSRKFPDNKRLGQA